MVQGGDPFSVKFEGGEIHDRSIRRDHRAHDISESLADENAGAFPFSTRFSRSVFLLVVLLVGAGFFLLFGRLFYLQIARGGFYREEAEQNRIKLERILPTRGLFFDRNGEPLVENVPNFEVHVIPAEFSYTDEDISSLAEILAINKEALDAELADTESISSVPVVVKARLTYDEAIAAEIKLSGIRGTVVQSIAERHYLKGESFAHLLGYVGKISELEEEQYPEYGKIDIVGKSGLETVYERPLHGDAGEQQIERDFLNNRKRTVARKDPVAGADLHLTIDAGLQERAYSALKDVIERTNVHAGAVVAIDPRNGEVRALVSMPSFDPNAFIQGLTTEQGEEYLTSEERPLFDRAVSGEYPSGSIIKPAIAAAALAEGVITSRTTVESTGGLRIGQWFFPDWRAGGHGVTDVYHAIADSVNTFFYTIGGGYEDFTGLGVARITDHLQKFGLNSVLGIDLPGEQNGFLPSKEWKEETKGERWYIGDTYNLSIGQGDLLVTPLQMANMMATIANGGTLYRPHIVEHTKYADGIEIFPEETVLNFQVEDASAIDIVQDALRQTVTAGSARSLNTLPIEVAAKTGTAQFGDGTKTHAWFTAYAPFDNPELAIAVIVEAGGEGSSTALPVVRAMLESYFEL
ncbi:MAG: penicillin-binding protein 2 [Patescibacteria group bacterium]|jgi:penicillin-binding protein 2